jgi:hypothetical protein
MVVVAVAVAVVDRISNDDCGLLLIMIVFAG